MHIVHLMASRPLGAEQTIDQHPQPIGLLYDDAGVFAQGRIRQLLLQQLGRAAQATQRVLDLVGQAAHQLLGRLLLGMLLQLLADLLLLIDLAQLHHHQPLLVVGHGAHADLHQPGLSLHHQGDFAVGEALP
ncbi:hypothetical protein D3C79_679190 [compost metagenome]